MGALSEGSVMFPSYLNFCLSLFEEVFVLAWEVSAWFGSLSKM